MSVVNVSGAPITLILGALGPDVDVPANRDSDSTWTSGDSAYVSFLLASGDSVEIAEGGWDVTHDDVRFDSFTLLGAGLELTARDAAIMSFFVERDGDLVFRVLPRIPADPTLASTYRQLRPGGHLERVSFYVAGESALMEFAGDSVVDVRFRREGNRITFMKKDDTLTLGIASVGRRHLVLSAGTSGDTTRQMLIARDGW